MTDNETHKGKNIGWCK